MPCTDALSDDTPGNYYGQFTYNADVVQVAFTALAGGNPLTWTEQMRAIIPTFLDAPNAAGAIASGVMHCTTILNGFFTQEVQGVPLVDWLRAMLGGALPQEWRLLDDLAGSAGNASALPVDEDEWGEEAQRMLCAARFIATGGEAWEGQHHGQQRASVRAAVPQRLPRLPRALTIEMHISL